MKHPKSAELSYFEARITNELAEVEAEIRKLEAAAETLRRQLGKAKAERLGLQDATRKNSVNRVLVENSVIEQLREKSPQKTDALYRRARLVYSDLKPTTFRTYLHRMKKRDLIRTARAAGEWMITPVKAPDESVSRYEQIISSVLKRQG